jgi:SAM-dependent methyltransferase
MDRSRIRSLIVEVRQQFPRVLWSDFLDKDVLHVEMAYVPNGRLIDLGGGYSPMSAVLARLGMDVTVVDTFASTKLYEQFSASELCDILTSFGVSLARADLREFEPATMFEPGSVDAIDCFGTILLFNPRQLLDRCVPVLRPGGKLILEFNNSVSLLRRMRVLFGRNSTDGFQDYFFRDWRPRFWVKHEVLMLAEYLKLSEWHVRGRNWTLYESRKKLPKWALRLADSTLRPFPSLCNDIYLIGRK